MAHAWVVATLSSFIGCCASDLTVRVESSPARVFFLPRRARTRHTSYTIDAHTHTRAAAARAGCGRRAGARCAARRSGHAPHDAPRRCTHPRHSTPRPPCPRYRRPQPGPRSSNRVRARAKRASRATIHTTHLAGVPLVQFPRTFQFRQYTLFGGSKKNTVKP